MNKPAKIIVVTIVLVLVTLLASCTRVPQFVNGGTYIIEGEYTSMHTDNGNYVYVVGGNTIILGNAQEQPSLTVGHVYKITWKLISDKEPSVIEIVSVEDKGEN